MASERKKWFEYMIKNRAIKQIPFEDLQDQNHLTTGTFATVFTAYWTTLRAKVAYKKLTFNYALIEQNEIDAFVKEVPIPNSPHFKRTLWMILFDYLIFTLDNLLFLSRSQFNKDSIGLQTLHVFWASAKVS